MEKILKNVDVGLIRNTNPFMYTEYPHKRYWSKEFGSKEFQTVLKSWHTNGETPPTMLYIHIPFCEQFCWFCTCSMKVTKNYQRIKNYIELLYLEIDLLQDFFIQNGIRFNIREIHLGGGSPTLLREEEFDKLIEKIGSIVDLKNLGEFSIEIDPRKVDKDRMQYYHQKGINRISFGLQDFDLNVQKAINRIQPPELIENLLTPEIRKLFKNGVSFDIICGLPLQTEKSIRETFERIVKISPDRICLNFLHYVPEFAKHQTIMADGCDGRPSQLPDMYERKDLFVEALGILLEGGYIRTGYDHFAKPTDSLSGTMEDRTMHWNALGVTPGVCHDVIGLGTSSISTIGDYYIQNFYEVPSYKGAVMNEVFPVYRGYGLDRDDIIRRDIIRTLRNFFFLDCSDIERRYDIEFKEYFEDELSALADFVKDELVEIRDDTIIITELGHQFANLVCRVFDAYEGLF